MQFYILIKKLKNILIDKNNPRIQLKFNGHIAIIFIIKININRI